MTCAVCVCVCLSLSLSLCVWWTVLKSYTMWLIYELCVCVCVSVCVSVCVCVCVREFLWPLCVKPLGHYRCLITAISVTAGTVQRAAHGCLGNKSFATPTSPPSSSLCPSSHPD